MTMKLINILKLIVMTKVRRKIVKIKAKMRSMKMRIIIIKMNVIRMMNISVMHDDGSNNEKISYNFVAGYGHELMIHK